MRLSSKIMIGVSAIIVTVNIAVFYLIGWRYEAHVHESLTDTARSFYKLIVVMRAWVAQHDGVYVIGDGGVEPNPYLPMTGLRSESGDSLMLRNPALVTRELSDLSQMMGKRFRFHITSLDPINPANAYGQTLRDSADDAAELPPEIRTHLTAETTAEPSALSPEGRLSITVK